MYCLRLYASYVDVVDSTQFHACVPIQSVEMMRNITTFHRLATAAVEKTAAGNAEGQKITFNVIKQRMGDTLYKVTAQKFEDPGVLPDESEGLCPASAILYCCQIMPLCVCMVVQLTSDHYVTDLCGTTMTCVLCASRPSHIIHTKNALPSKRASTALSFFSDALMLRS